MRVRTIEQAYAEIKKIDPDCALGKSGLRRLIVSGQIPSRRAGNKYLVTMEAVEAYMNGETVHHEPAPGYGEIRPVG